MTRLRVAVVGVGHLGKEHARILAGLPEAELVGVADVNIDQARAVAQRCGTQAFPDYWPLLNLVDAVTVVVPTTYHFAVASEFLRRGIPVLVEKPLAVNLEQAEALVRTARENHALLQVGHIERFNPAFEDLASRRLQPKFVECERLGPFSGRSTDVGVVLDLMIHDLDLLLALVGSPVVRVEAIGVSVFGRHEDAANARLEFANGCVANVSASRANPKPYRSLRVWSPEGYAAVDFAQKRLTLIQPSEQFRQTGWDPRRSDPAAAALFKEQLFGRHLEVQELDHNRGDQLTAELRHFLHCIQTATAPRVGGEEALGAMALASRVLEQIASHSWEGRANGPIGPLQLPAPLGPLFLPADREAA